jgi:hypothetical protein
MTRLFKDNINFRNGQMVIEEDGQVQEIITTSDAKQFFSTAVNEFFMQDDAAADTQWQDIFRVVPGRGHGELFPFRPPTTVDTVNAATSLAAEDEASSGSHGIVFNEVGEGGEIKFSRIVSAEKYVRHVKYATAIGYSNEWFSDGQMSLVEMVTEDFRAAANDKMAAIHYGAIVASVTSGLSDSTAYAAAPLTGGGNGGAIAGLVNAMNTVTTTMRRARRQPGIILCAPENEQPLRIALNTQGLQSSGNPPQTEATSRLRLIVSEYIADGTAYVIEPKKRLISTNRLPLSLGNFQDLLHDSEVLVGKFRRGVLVGEAAVIHAITSMPSSIVNDSDI